MAWAVAADTRCADYRLVPDCPSVVRWASAQQTPPNILLILGDNIGYGDDDRPVDGVDQSDLLLGKNSTRARDQPLTFVCADLVAVHWERSPRQ